MEQFTGLEYCKIAVANAFGHGLNKKSWTKRIKFVDTLSLHELHQLIDDADDRFMYIRSLIGLEAAINKEPSGYFIGLDATASGLQISAILSGCLKTARWTNLIYTGIREDIHTGIAKRLNKQMNTHFTTKEVKSPIMTYFYGSRAVPESVFGEGPVLQAFYNILVEEMPGAVEVMEDIQSCWNDQAFAHTWTLPDGHKAIVKVMEPVTKKIEIDELNHRSFSYKTYINKPAQQGISLLANIVQSIDAYIVREMVRRAYHMGYQLVTTHDNFWCHPNYMNETRQNYMDIMVELAHMPLLENILKEVTNNPNLKHTKIDNDLYKHMDGEYAIC